MQNFSDGNTLKKKTFFLRDELFVRLSDEGHSPKQEVGGGDLLINNNKLEGTTNHCC